MSGKISVISFSEQGFKFQKSLRADINQWAALQEMETEWYCKDKSGYGADGYIPVMMPTREWSAARFEDSDIIVYICTVAKAVRNFGPAMKGQSEDPAVVAIDQLGKYCIPVLPGRKGEAYELSSWLDDKSGLTTVNSGGSVPESAFSIDRFAMENDLTISNANYVKEITAAMDSGEKIGFYTSFPVKGDLPEGLDWAEKGPLGIYLSPSYHNAYFVHTLWLIPKCLEVGITVTNTDATPRDIGNVLNDLLKKLSVYPESISEINYVGEDDTAAVRIFCGSNGFKLNLCKEEDLSELRSGMPHLETFECAALLDGESQIISKESTENGIQIALAMKKIYVDFEA